MYKRILVRDYAQHQHWQNMIDYLSDHHETDEYCNVPTAIINSEIKQFDAVFREYAPYYDAVTDKTMRADYLEFENEQGYIMYLLKWA